VTTIIQGRHLIKVAGYCTKDFKQATAILKFLKIPSRNTGHYSTAKLRGLDVFEEMRMQTKLSAILTGNEESLCRATLKRTIRS
jgi:hypothetical protein